MKSKIVGVVLGVIALIIIAAVFYFVINTMGGP